MIRRLLLFTFVLSVAGSSFAWDRVGHMTVCAIAWEQMSDPARERAYALLAAAPSDSDLFSPHFTPAESFQRAGYWPDIVRDEAYPGRKERYDRPTWHYVNHFWREGGTPLPEKGTIGDLVIQLESLDPRESGVSLAWFLHLAADVHQPLHSSARVTDREPKGDRGGNDFTLDDPSSWNLHAYWDSILKRSFPQRHSESAASWVARIAAEIAERHPDSSLSEEVDDDDFAAWSRSGSELAMAQAYPPELARDARPSKDYELSTREASERQVALAGYRIAKRLNALFE